LHSHLLLLVHLCIHLLHLPHTASLSSDPSSSCYPSSFHLPPLHLHSWIYLFSCQGCCLMFSIVPDQKNNNIRTYQYDSCVLP
jgi:hypothetical protein